MEYLHHKDLMPSIRELHQKSGRFVKAAEQVQAVIGRIQMKEVDVFGSLKLTKNGESRINKCLKYDLIGFSRLITIQDNGVILLCFTGDHKKCDDWLTKNKGMTIVADDANKFGLVSMSSVDGGYDNKLSGLSALTKGKLFESIHPEIYFDKLIEGLPRSITRQLESLESIHDENTIFEIATEVKNSENANAIYDVFCLLRQDKRSDALNRIKVFTGEACELGELSEQEVSELAESENIKRIDSNDPRFQVVFEHFVKTASYMDWMLFLHPDQHKIVDTDFPGPTKLVGVSGSGKTCMVVQRAVRLAEKYKDQKILVLTLNRQLASLIKNMVDSACTKDLRDLIEVKPFFTICQEMLHEFEPDNIRLYDDVTWKSKEHIDEVWREYYRCELNNGFAAVLHPLHDSLIARGVDAEQYIREEFDWIRSAVPIDNRKAYLDLERSGRSYPLDKKLRSVLLDGLRYWEEKMCHVGVTDYLGLSTALNKHIDKLTPLYRCVLIDESQDFGTIEYVLIRKLAEANENDLLFCGDAAQQVSAKHRSFKVAGINIPSARSLSIKKNYRNSREILLAAYGVLSNNYTEEMLDLGEFDILNPEYANFSAAPPLMLSAECLEDEIEYSLKYLKDMINEEPEKKYCLALCGYSLYQIQKFGKKYELKVLDGSISIEHDHLYLSDLEHTKGFEFDVMVIINCNENILPDISKPDKEQFRDLARFYVAMTRAKTELIVSYSKNPSLLLLKAMDNFLLEEWCNYVSNGEMKHYELPPTLDEIRYEDDLDKESVSLFDMSGPEFLYTKHALGLSNLLIDKLRNVVTGKSLIRDGYPVAWKTLRQAKLDTDQKPRSRLAFGSEGIVQFQSLIKAIDKNKASLSTIDIVAMDGDINSTTTTEQTKSKRTKLTLKRKVNE